MDKVEILKELKSYYSDKLSFKESLKKLNIEDYGERIFNSNSRGELFHLIDYIILAKNLPETSWFREWFVAVVAEAEQNWERPESVFQHIPKILANSQAHHQRQQ